MNKRVFKSYNDSTVYLLGITSETTLNQMIEGGLIPSYSNVMLWISDNTIYGKEIRDTIRMAHGLDVFGQLTISRDKEGRELILKAYDTPVEFVTGYTSINNVGWYGQWYKIDLRE